MIGVTVRGADDVARRLSAAARQTVTQIERQLYGAAILVQRAVRKRMSNRGGRHPFWGRLGGSGDALAARSGISRASVRASRARRVGGALVASVGSPLRHVGFLEQGGTIQGNPYLRIPLAEMQTAQGVDRMAGQSARGLQKTFVFKSKRGNLFIGTRGRSGELVPLYLLKHSVNIRGRHVFARSREDAEPDVQRVMKGAVTQVVRVANGA